MIGQRAAVRAAHVAGGETEDERDPVGIDGRVIQDETIRYSTTNSKQLIHEADSFLNQRQTDQQTSSKVSQTQDCLPFDPHLDFGAPEGKVFGLLVDPA